LGDDPGDVAADNPFGDRFVEDARDFLAVFFMLTQVMVGANAKSAQSTCEPEVSISFSCDAL
jgi:hypothetical protein